MSVRSRLARLEAKQRPEPVSAWATFLWADNAAPEDAEKAAEVEGRNIMVICLVAPEMDANGKAITTTGATHG